MLHRLFRLMYIGLLLLSIMYSNGCVSTTHDAVVSSIAKKDQVPLSTNENDTQNASEVVAFVGNEKITRAELNFALARLPETQLSPAQQRMILENLINKKILLIMQKNAGIVCTAKEVDDELKADTLCISEEEYNKRLIALGKTKEDFEEDSRQGIMEKILLTKFMYQLAPDITVTDEEVKNDFIYNQVDADFKRKAASLGGMITVPQKEYRMSVEEMEKAYKEIEMGMPAYVKGSYILVKLERMDSTAWIKGKIIIDLARARILEGKSFNDVIKEFSNNPNFSITGDDECDINSSRMGSEFFQHTLDQKIGEVSEPFRTQSGWNILKMTFRIENQKDEIKERCLFKKKEPYFLKAFEKAKSEIPVTIQNMPE